MTLTDLVTVGSMFTGVGMIDLGLEQAGCKVIWQAEVDPKASEVLARHWPVTPNLGDVTRIDWSRVERPDLISGGFPCQTVSVAGQRKGQDDERWLWPEFARALRVLRPRYALIENVPGLLSPIAVKDERGRFLGWRPAPVEDVFAGLADLGYGFAWRVLDAQFFGVAQRRRRVFVVGCLGDRARAEEVLFEPEGGAWDPPPSRAARENLAGTLGGGSGRRGWCDDLDRAGAFDEGSGYSNGNRGPVGALDTFGGGPDDNSAQAGHLVRVNGVVMTETGQSFWREGKPLIDRHEAKDPRALVLTERPGVETFVAQCHGSNVGEMGALRRGNGGVTGGVPFVAERAVPLTAGGHPNSNEPGRHAEDDVNLVAFHMTQDPITEPELAPRLGASSGGMGVAYPIQDARGRTEKAQNGTGVAEASAPAYTVDGAGLQGVAYPLAVRGRGDGADLEMGQEGVYNALRAADSSASRNPLVAYRKATAVHGVDVSGDTERWEEAESRVAVVAPQTLTVRRLTPTECERLQGLPDGWTEWGVKTKDLPKPEDRSYSPEVKGYQADSARYRQIGNGCAVPVIRWIGRRLVVADAVLAS